MVFRTYFRDAIAISDICDSSGDYTNEDVIVMNYIHGCALDSGQGTGYFMKSPTAEQAADIWKLGKDIGLGDENDLHLKIETLNSSNGKKKEDLFADVMLELYNAAKEADVANAGVLLKKAMLYMNCEYRDRMLQAYETDILPALERIERAPDEISRNPGHML